MSKNKKCLLVTFDYTQKGKSATSFAAGVLLSECRQHKDYGQKFTAEHLSIDMNKNKALNLSAGEIANRINGQHKLEEIDGLALGCYVWNTELIEP